MAGALDTCMKYCPIYAVGESDSVLMRLAIGMQTVC